MRINVVFAESEMIPIAFDDATENLSADIGSVQVRYIIPPTYTGETTVTPSEEEQTLLTDGFLMANNITINPIPSNYGLITWDGSKLIVS